MFTVPEAAMRSGRHPETIRRWIREGKLPARKVGTQHLIDEEDLALLEDDERLPAPPGWSRTFSDEPMPNWVAILRRQRSGH
ncbi:MAG: helix-turn-helix domain-containing protein [Actinomycetota bacterium]